MRAVSLLASLAATDIPQTLTEVAARTGLSVPTTFRLLHTLRAEGLVATGEELRGRLRRPAWARFPAFTLA